MRSEPPNAPVQTETLYAVIGAIADGPDLERVLRAVVDLLVDATACHACFIYLRDGERLRIQAASPVFAHVVGRVSLHMSEGLTGWVARNRTPAFIRDAALNDPRMKYIPELEEERFQSMVAVPLVGRHGDVIGVVVLHTEAPREFEKSDLDLLVHVASLVAGAIDNARLYDETQRQVTTLSALSDLSQQLASLTSRQQLYVAGCDGIRQLLAADGCRLAILDTHGAPLEVATSPADIGPDRHPLVHASGSGRLTAQLLEGAQPFGVVHVVRKSPFTEDDSRLLQTAANQLAIALRTAGQIERLASENIVRQIFAAVESGSAHGATTQAAAAGWDPSRSHVCVVATPYGQATRNWEEQLSPAVHGRLRAISASCLIDIDSHRLRALVPVSGTVLETSVRRLRDDLNALGAELTVNFGISRPRATFANDATILNEARDAAIIATALIPEGGAQAYEDLGAYRFLVGLIGSTPPDPIHARALAILAEYDQRRRSSLVETLDAYLDARGAARVAADALVIHTNTLRQRVDRIQELTGLQLETEDLLSLQLSLKLHLLMGVAARNQRQ